MAPMPEEPDDDNVLVFVQLVAVGLAETVMLCGARQKVTLTSLEVAA